MRRPTLSVMSKTEAGVPRTVGVDGARLPRWRDGFVTRHGAATATATTTGLILRAVDGAVAEVFAPFTPWTPPGPAADPEAPDDPVRSLTEHVLRERRLAVLLVRRGGYACVLLDGIVVRHAKIGTRHVQGRTAAGGWSQQRFARRREKQTDELTGAVTEVAVRLLVPELPVQALITGGDVPLLESVLADPRLRALAATPRGAHLAIGDPRPAMVRELPDLIHRLRILVTEP